MSLNNLLTLYDIYSQQSQTRKRIPIHQANSRDNYVMLTTQEI